MVVEYSIDVPCEPKRRFRLEGLFDRLRRLARVMGNTASGWEERTEARQAEFELRPLAFHCGKCPANYAARAFGCCGIVQAPISEDAEEWLIELLPETLRGKPSVEGPSPGQLEAVPRLARRLRELGVNGKALDERYRKGTLLQARRGAVQRYGFLFGAPALSTSQIFQLLFAGETVTPADAELLCRALGVWEDGETGDDGLPEVIFTQPPDDEDDTSILQLKQFFLALMHGCSLGVPVRTRIYQPPAPGANGNGSHPKGSRPAVRTSGENPRKRKSPAPDPAAGESAGEPDAGPDSGGP